MNFFNEIDKVSYNKETKDPIQLLEYIKFADEKNQEKYVLFKFKNTINQIASSIKLEIKQYDKDNNLLQKTSFTYDNFKAKGQEVFVPTAKLKVNFDTDHIEAKLTRATFESIWWDGAEFLPRQYTMQKFEEEYVNPENKDVPSKKAVRETEKVNKIRGSRKTKYKNITKTNRPLFPKILTFILTLAFIGISVLVVVQIRMTSKYIHDTDFEYEILDKENLKIIDYLGDNKQITIPSKFKTYNVSVIGEEVFKESNITTLTFLEGNIEILSNAFEGCSSLRSIKDENGCVTDVATEAFKDCTRLETIILPNAVISSRAFTGCTAVDVVNIKSFYLDSITSAFSSINILSSLETKQSRITSSFFNYIDSIDTLILSGSSTVEIDALEGVSLEKLVIGKDAIVDPMCLAKFERLEVELDSHNSYTVEDYKSVNPELRITTK